MSTALGQTASAVNVNHHGILTTRRVEHRPSPRRRGLDWDAITRPGLDPDAVARLTAQGILVVEEQPASDDQPTVVRRTRKVTHRGGNGGATKGRRKLDDHTRAAIAQAWATDPDATMKDLAARHGVHPVTIKAILTEAGAAKAKGSHKPHGGGRTLAADTDAVARDYLADTALSISDVARAHGISRTAVRSALHRAGVTIRPHGGGRPTGYSPIPEEEERAICDAYSGGTTVPALAEEFGRYPATIRRILHRHGIPLRDDRKAHSGGHNRLPQAVRDAVLRLHTSEGLDGQAIAERLRIGTSSVSRIIRTHQEGQTA